MLKPSRALQASLSLDLFGRAHKIVGRGKAHFLVCTTKTKMKERTKERENEKKTASHQKLNSIISFLRLPIPTFPV
jgi:hypothetical protein